MVDPRSFEFSLLLKLDTGEPLDAGDLYEPPPSDTDGFEDAYGNQLAPFLKRSPR